MTALWPDWIEHGLSIAPDGGDGSLEWGWVVTLGITAMAWFADAARTHGRRRIP